eukprot:g2033.t2 g2033   contig11:571013-574227(+)
MLGEVALDIGPQLTATELVPLLPPLVKDGESIIRQRICVELKILCLVLMGMTTGVNKETTTDGGSSSSDNPLVNQLPQIPKPNKPSKYYKVMVHHIFPHLYTLISDPDNEVRRAASETIVKLALRVDPDDVVNLAVSIPLRLVKEGQKRAAGNANNAGGAINNNTQSSQNQQHPNPQTPAEDLLITSSNLLADLASFLPPNRLSPQTTSQYLSPTILSLADDPNFRVRRAAVQALPRMLGSATLDDVKRRLLPKFVSLSGDEMYRVRKASGECLVDVSRALGILAWRFHFGDVWLVRNGGEEKKSGDDGGSDDDDNSMVSEEKCYEIRRRALCAIAKNLLEDNNKFVRYGMMQFLGPLIASFYPLDRGSMVGGMGGLLFGTAANGGVVGKGGGGSGALVVGVESVGIAKSSIGLERAVAFEYGGPLQRGSLEDILSYNHSLHGLELILHGESPISHDILGLGGGGNANQSPFGTMGPQFFPHANGMVGRSSALDDDDTDALLLSANLKKQGRNNAPATDASSSAFDPRSLLPKFILESRSDALALSRIVLHRNGRIPNTNSSSSVLPYPPLMVGRPDAEDLASMRAALLPPFVAMASCRTGEETTDAEMRVYCAYSLPAVILLFGGVNWEQDGLKECFLELIGRTRSLKDDDETDEDDDEEDDDKPLPPLPVKRCLASSIHAVAHMLGPDVVSSDKAFLASFERAFLRDPDEAIRLNILKNVASFLAALPPGDGEGHRNHYLPVIHSVVMGDDVLSAAKKRSASNPGVLNWRQRDAVARVLPDLMMLYSPSLNREYIWPILKALLSDSVSAVREDAGWSVPVLLRSYIKARYEKAWTSEVVEWLKDTFLGDGCGKNQKTSSRRSKKQMVASEGAFSRRQGYCRICAAVALAMRMGEAVDDEDGHNNAKSKKRDNSDGSSSIPIDPFGKLSPAERGVFRSILLNDLLPPALDMTVDCVANVRLTLTKCLKVLPLDIRTESHVEDVLTTLEEELMTWDVGDMPLNDLGGGTTSPASIGAMPMGSLDPPMRSGIPAEGVVMTSTMSAC